MNKLAVVLKKKHLQLPWLQKAAWSYFCGRELNKDLTDFLTIARTTTLCLNHISCANSHSHSPEPSSCPTLAVHLCEALLPVAYILVMGEYLLHTILEVLIQT